MRQAPHPTLLSLLCLTSTLCAQAKWTMLAPATVPGARNSTAMVFDAQRARGVMYGGFGGGVLQDTWEWSGSNWTLAAAGGGPGIRNGHAMAYDSGRGVTVFFGGAASGSLGRSDTWEWNGTTWTQRATGGPPGRVNHQLAYDAGRGVTVLFGGHVDYNAGPNLDDTWEWNGTTWTQRAPANKPPKLTYHAMAYDAGRGVTVLFGGRDPNNVYRADTWEWNGTDWTQRAPAASPPGMGDHEMCYDSFRGRIVIGSSFSGIADVFEYDGNTWIQRVVAPNPGVRYAYGFAFDSVRRQVVLFGGFAGGQRSDTWVWASDRPAAFATFGTGCAGLGGVPAVAAGSLPWAGDTFVATFTSLPPGQLVAGILGGSNTTWAGNALPLDLTSINMPDCFLLVSFDLTLGLTNAGGTASWAIPLPGLVTLGGQHFYVQAAAVSPGSNGLGVVTSNGGDATVGLR